MLLKLISSATQRKGVGGLKMLIEPVAIGKTVLQKKLTNPCPVQVDGDEGRRDGEVVDERVELQHEPELVARCYELKRQTKD